MGSSCTDSVLPDPPEAGVLLHITSLPGRYGIGSVGREARQFVDVIHGMGLRVWQFLPLGPTSYGDSPYQPLSTFAGNEMLIGIDDLIEWGLLTADEAEPLSRLPQERTDYGALIPLKQAVLQQAVEHFEHRASAALTAAFKAFVQTNSDAWLHDYALYRVLKAQHEHRAWTEWPPPLRDRHPEAIEQFCAAHADQLHACRLQQFWFDHQWRQLRTHAEDSGVRLFGDLPIYIALDSADAWARRDLLAIDTQGRPERVAGVPPDYFSEDGQLWGNPVFDWPVHRAEDFDWWIRRLKRAASQADWVRIDHFRGLESYWSVPADATSARHGEWVEGPGDAFFEAVKAAFGRQPLVAEDLGLITPEVDELRDRHGLPGMVVLQFKVDEDEFSLENVPENCVCYTGTHDNDTTLGWFKGAAGDTRSADSQRKTRDAAIALCDGAEETIAIDMIRAMFSTSSRLCIAPMQDYLELGSDARFNTPGVAGNNWQWRLTTAQITPKVIAKVRALVAQSGRGL